MKTKIFTLFVVLLATTNLWAYDFEIDGIYYNITSENTVEVTAKSCVDKDGLRWNEDWNIDVVIIPATVTYNSNIYNVTSIGENAFRECKSLISATLPNSITTILNGAFSDCTELKLINIPDGVKTIGSNEQTTGAYTSGAFLNCCSLVDITIPNSIVSIEGLAFADCTGLTTITIPNSVTTIYESAFREVPNVMYSGMAEGYPWGARSVNGYIEGWLVYKDASKSQLLACSSAATDEINLPNSVTSIGERAFYNCTSIFSITIPNSATSIGEYAFCGCSSIFTITIPNSVTSIGLGAFEYIPNIVYHGTAEGAPWGAQYHNAYVEGWLLYSDASKNHILTCSYRAYGEIEIPNSVTTIEDYAFAGCNDITSVNIPNSVTLLGESSFSGCRSLTKINVALENQNYSDIDGVLFDKTQNTLIQYPCGRHGTYTVPSSVKYIGEGAFEYCINLTSITIPNSVIEIKDYAFYECSNLNSITIPNSTISIGHSAWRNCTNLNFVIIGNSVTQIGKRAFEDCTNLTSITSYAINPPICGEYIFENVNKYIPLNVLKESLLKYQIAEHWREFIHINGIETPSNIENTNVNSENPIKFLLNGQINILNKSKTYNVIGQEL